jgi:oligopeptide transport system substrate-binding protein
MRVQQVRGYRAVAVGVAGLLMLAGCGGGGGGNTAAQPSTGASSSGQSGAITVSGCRPQNPLIPSDTNETCGGNILDQVTAKLVRYDPETGNPSNDIAESIDTTNSKLYTIKLKHGIKFHDGTEVKAKNFVDAWNFAAYAGNAQVDSSFFEPIKGYQDVSVKDSKVETMSGLKVVDDYTFTATMDRKYAIFPLIVGYTAFAPLPDSFFADKGAEFQKHPIGAGPFKFVSGDPDNGYVLEADPNYDRIGKPHIQRVTYKVYTTPQAAYNDIINNQLDMLDVLPSTVLVGAVYQKDIPGRSFEKTVGQFQALDFPPSSVDSSYDNPKLRHAISMAIDRQSIIDAVFGGTKTAATGWVSPVVNGYKAGACGEWCTFNPNRAKQLYDEAGGHKGPITISYNTGEDADHGPWITAVCNSIHKVLGAECDPTPVATFKAYRDEVQSRHMEGMFRAGWQMDYPSIEDFLTPLYATKASSNDNDYANASFDAKLKEAGAETSLDAANAAYQMAEQMLGNDMPSAPMWSSKLIGGFSNRVANAGLTVFGTYNLAAITLK